MRDFITHESKKDYTFTEKELSYVVKICHSKFSFIL